jgi:GT2 family glycosyltransferase
MDPSVTAVIVTHNRAELLRRCIRSIRVQQPTVPPLMVIDNASTDHTAAVLREECPDATVIRLSRNVGWSAARNIAARAATTDVLFFVDDDSELAAEAVACATGAIMTNARIAVLVGTIIENGQPIRLGATAGPSFLHVCHGQSAMRRAAFLDVGMYPADFFYAEEMDLSLRLLEAGFDIVLDPRVVLFHAYDQATRRPYGDIENERNMLRVVMMRAPPILLVPWALKKICNTLTAAWRTREPITIAAELLRLPRAVIGGIARRRPVGWETFAAWRYLSTTEVNTADYRHAALARYPNRWALFLDYVRPGHRPSGVPVSRSRTADA